MADLETLTLRITQESTKAFSAIDKLAKRLDGLSVAVAKLEVGKLNDLASGLTNLNTAINLIKSSTKQADYTRIFKELSTLGSVDSGRLDGLSAALVNLSAAFQGLSGATSVTASVNELISSINKLGHKTVTQAIANIPQLETALGHLITSFSQLPNINQSVIDFTNSLANLASQGQRVGTASNTITNSLERFGASANRAARRTHSLASTIGTLYAKFWLFLRGARALKNSFLSAADYLEAFNYFDVTAKKIGKDTFAKAGVGSAQDYADAFTSTLQEKLKKMSGLELDLEDRLIKTTNAKSLGLNITEVTQYQASIASLTNSLGVTQDIAASASKALSMLAGDIGSLRNMDFSEVSSKLQSGLTGMARSLYSFGIDITNATLQEYAYANGIEKAVSEMSQSEKVQLRLLAILDQSKVAWGDLANTINSPSNQLRMLKTNLKEVGTVFGQLFIPVMQSVLPVLNGLSMAIKQLMVDIAQLLGIKLDLDSFGTFGDEVDADVESVEDLNSAIKETKKGIRDFDELKVINDSSNKNAGLGAEIDLTKQILEATAEYEKVWDEAYERMKSKASEIAAYISGAFEPIKKIIEDFHIGDFFKAGEDVSLLVASIFNFISEAIDSVDWMALGNKIGEFLKGLKWTEILKGIENIIASALQAVLNLWKGLFEVAPFETALLSAFAVLKFTGFGDIITSGLSKALGKQLTSQKMSKEFATALGKLGTLSIGIGLALTIDNVQSIKAGEYTAISTQSLLKSGISALFSGAGISLLAKSIGFSGGLVTFGIGAAISLLANITLAIASMQNPYEAAKTVTDAEYQWITDYNLQSMEIKTDIDLRGSITQDTLDNIDDLAEKVWDLSQDYDNLTAVQKGWLKEYSDQLVQAVPSIAGSIDKITGAYIGTKDALQELIDKEKEQILLESYRESLTQTQSAILQTKNNIKSIWNDQEENKNQLESAKQRLENALGTDYDESIYEWIVKNLREGISPTSGLWEGGDLSAEQKERLKLNRIVPSSDAINEIAKAIAKEDTLREKEQESAKALKELTNVREDLYKQMSNTFEETFGSLEEIASVGIDNTEEIIKQNKLPKAMGETIDKINQTIDQKGKVSEYDMKSLFTSINNSFAGLGTGEVPKEVQDTMAAIKVAIINNSPELIKLMQNLKIQMEEAFVNAKYTSSGEVLWNVNGISSKLDNDVKSIQEALDRTAKPTLFSLEKDLKELFGDELPKSVDGALSDLADTINTGKGKDKVLNALERLENEVVIAGHDLGMNLEFGCAEGVYAGIPQLTNATEDMVDYGLVDPYKKKTKTSSPSKLFEELAEYIPEGAAIGVEKGTPKLELAISDMVNGIKSAFGDYRYNIPKIDYGGNYSQRRYDYGTMDSNNQFMSQLSGVATQMSQNGQTEVVFRVEGDPYGIFKVVREENDSFKKQHHYSAFR